MQLAMIGNELTIPKPGLKAVCPICKEEVIPKCGDINIWHWAHVKGTDCDSWSEPETEWHIQWKECFPKENREVTIGPHRADVQWMGRIIEFQHSPINQVDICNREVFYGSMIWVLDGSSFTLHNALGMYGELQEKGYCRWLWMHKAWLVSEKTIFIDRGEHVFKIRKFTDKGFYFDCITKDKFKRQYLNLRIDI